MSSFITASCRGRWIADDGAPVGRPPPLPPWYRRIGPGEAAELEGGYLVPVKTVVQRAEQVDVGDEIEVELRIGEV